MIFKSTVKVWKSATQTVTYESQHDTDSIENATIAAMVEARVAGDGELISVHVFTNETPAARPELVPLSVETDPRD